MSTPSQASTPEVRRSREVPWSLLVLVIGIAIAIIWMSQLVPGFISASNFVEIGKFSTEIGLMALGMTFVIITAGIDLSVGSNLALSAIVMGWLFAHGTPIPLAVLASLLTGTLAGFLNGLIVTRAGIPPLIVTLATLAIYRGLALGISQANSFQGYPNGFLFLGAGYILGVPVQLFVFAVVGLVAWWLLSRTVLGRFVYAIGNNATAARFAGVPVDRVLLVVYSLSGLLAALAGVIFTARVSSIRADAGLGNELDAITAVVLGGASVSGGSGGIGLTLLGLFLVGIVRRGLFLAFINADQQSIIIGLILLVAVLINQIIRLRSSNRV